MLMSLIQIECKQLLRSILYYVFLLCMFLFYFTQMNDTTVVKPNPNSDYYGLKILTDETEIMNYTVAHLVNEYLSNEYVTYPIGFYKKVVLSEEEQSRIKEIIDKIVADPENLYSSASLNQITIQDGISFDDFMKSMEKVASIVGAGSDYEAEKLYSNARVPMTYEEALADYESILKEDRVTGAIARLFADYMGIVLGILPIFLIVNRALSDQKKKVYDVIASKSIPSYKLLLSRFLSMIIMIILPLILLSIMPTLQGMYSASSSGVSGDPFAFISVIFLWLLPTVFVILSLGYLLTELLNSAVGIFIQMGWWMISIFSGSSNLVGHVGTNLIPRFNSIGDHDIFASIYPDLVLNRLIYTALGIVFLLATILLVEYKRKGAFRLHGKLNKNLPG